MNGLESHFSFELPTIINGHLCEKLEPLKVREICYVFKVFDCQKQEIHVNLFILYTLFDKTRAHFEKI